VTPPPAICAAFGLDPAEGRFHQHAANVVYRFPRAGALLRLTPSVRAATQLVRVAGALTAAGAPVIELRRGAPQPVVAGGWAATAWRLLPPPPAERWPAADLAGPLRALHATRLGVPLTPWDLAGDLRACLAATPDSSGAWIRDRLGSTPAELLTRLTDRCEDLAAQLAATPWELPPATVHGDAHTGNLLRTDDGRAVLCDLDTVAWGPPEADLTPVAHGVSRFGRSITDYLRFARTYGYDVRESPGWSALRRLRDLQLAVYFLPRPEIGGNELAHRLRTVLTDDEAALWHRYPRFA
jgi:aminoglycoside phosphotransferase (APT) family kinase protein